MLSIKKQSLVDMVYHKLRESIIQLQLPLGSKLNVNELQARMGVSCTPIREAINRLQQEGLVVYENNVGAHIISLAPHDVLEIQQLAMTLHAAAIHLAMVNGDRATIVAELRKQLEDYTNAKTEHDEVMAVKEFSGHLLPQLRQPPAGSAHAGHSGAADAAAVYLRLLRSPTGRRYRRVSADAAGHHQRRRRLGLRHAAKVH